MTADPADAEAAESRLHADIVLALCLVTGTDPAESDRFEPAAQLEADLRLDSIELVALGQLLAERFGPAVQLTELLASLDFDQLIELTVGQLTDFVTGRLAVASR